MNTKQTIDPKSAATNVGSQPHHPAVTLPASTPRHKRRIVAAAPDITDAAGQVLATEASVEVLTEQTVRQKGGRNSKAAASPDPKPARGAPSRSSSASAATTASPSNADGRDEQSVNKGRESAVACGESASGTSLDGSKTGLVLKKLRLAGGASIAQLSAATAWQAHSVRGFLSAVVRKRLKLELASEVGKDGVRRYRIADGAAS